MHREQSQCGWDFCPLYIARTHTPWTLSMMARRLVLSRFHSVTVIVVLRF